MKQHLTNPGLTWETWEGSKKNAEPVENISDDPRPTGYRCVLGLFIFGLVLLVASFACLEMKVKGDEATTQIGKLAHDLSVVRNLEKPVQSFALLNGSVTYHDGERSVREFDASIAGRLGALWSSLRREALAGTATEAMMDNLIGKANQDLRLVSARTSQWEIGEIACRFVGLFALVTGLGLAIHRIRTLAEPIVIQKIVTQEVKGTTAVVALPPSPTAWSTEDGRRTPEALFSSLPSACCSFNQDGKVTAWNPEMENLMGIQAARALGTLIWETIGWQQMGELTKSIMNRLFEGQDVDFIEWVYDHPTGERLSLRAKMVPLQNSMGTTTGALATISDVSYVHKLERKILDGESLKDAMYSAIPESLLRIDSIGRLLEVKDNLNIFSSNAYDFLDSPHWIDGLDNGVGEAILAQACALRAGKAANIFTCGSGREFEVRMVSCGSQEFLVLVRHGLMSPKNNSSDSLLRNEIASLRQHVESLSRLDPLTGLANHRAAREYLANLPGAASLVFIDFAGFSTYNEAAGYLAGDQLLQGVAQQLSSVNAQHYARWSGHRLAVIILAEGASEAEMTMRKWVNEIHSELPVLIGMAWAEAGANDSLVRLAGDALRACDPATGKYFVSTIVPPSPVLLASSDY